jgi:UDP-GlcNAc:undecaprenyl-phosphate GlcNAc-1-phosphate transferase
LALFILAFIISAFLTPLFRKIAIKTHFIDTPTGQLKKHTAPVPYLGGLAIYFAFLLVLMIAIVKFQLIGELPGLALLVGATIMALLGLVDDLFSLTPLVKFLVQTLAATLIVGFGIRMKFISITPISWILSIIWIVGITNALNIIDIMDGLAGGVVIIAALGFLFVPFSEKMSYVNLVASILAGSTLGFLIYNFQPAKIYMGDTGALFVGFILAGISMGESYTARNVVAIYAPILILGVPIFDTILVMFLRFLKGKSMFRGSNDHLALRLKALGFSVKQVVSILWGLSLLGILAARILVRVSEKRALVLFIVIVFLVMLGTIFISMVPMDMALPSKKIKSAIKSSKKRSS